MHESVRFVDFQINGDPSEGYLSIMEELREVPFAIRRAFITFDTPPGVQRGGHAHFDTEMLLIAATGTITVRTEDQYGHLQTAILDTPSRGLYLPVMCWHTMDYSDGARQVVLASTAYSESDYIRDHQRFVKLCQPFRK